MLLLISVTDALLLIDNQDV